ncbi:lipopolysaccharide biosynthesis protein [Gordonia sp. CPCC 205333]|uniref:lipopolysaccharide biosynthesis protein n=1 Tax=Gordonia sp. CPCC 205333 TaxID=3140790 RepID=UPI003AF38A5C
MNVASDAARSSNDSTDLRRVTVATVIAAASGYLVLLLAARQLGAAAYASFAVFWAAYGMVTGAQNGQLQETTRAIRNAASDGPAPAIWRRPLGVNAVIGIGLGLLVAASSWLWAPHVFDSSVGLSVALLAVGVVSFAAYAHLCGTLSGSVSWSTFAALLTVDALIRLAGATAAFAMGLSLNAFLVITVIGSVSWMLVLATSATARRVIGLGADVAPRTFATNTLTAMAAALASAVLVMGFPVLIRITAPDSDDAAAIGAVILAITLTRAPLLVPLNSFQGVLITRFVDQRHRLVAALGVPFVAVAGIGVVGALAAAMIGPWLMTSVFGGGYELPGITLAWFTIGATLLALLTITGACVLAVGAHRWFAAGWWLATAASVALLFVPLGVQGRVSVALIAGPVVGIVVHMVACSRRGGLR